MFVGHAALAFALVAWAAALSGVDRERALVLGGLAGVFATVPDVDILYAVAGVVPVWSAGVWRSVDAFWATGSVVHRAVTHSLLLGAPAAVGFALVPDRRWWPLGVALLAGLSGWVLVAGGPLAGAVAVVAFVSGGAVAVVASAQFDVGPRGVLLAAAAGLLTHPFGDLFTGEPPALLYPLDAAVLGSRLTLHPDPTLHLLAAFGIELATIWLAVAVALRLRSGGRRSVSGELRALVDRRASLATGYAGAALVMPAPTLDVSYHFVFSVLAVGAVALLVAKRPRDPRVRPVRSAVTGLAAVSLAWLAYVAAYLAL